MAPPFPRTSTPQAVARAEPTDNTPATAIPKVTILIALSSPSSLDLAVRAKHEAPCRPAKQRLERSFRGTDECADA